MTRERFVHLMDLVDKVNDKNDYSAYIEHGVFGDQVHITLPGPDDYIVFDERDFKNLSTETHVFGDFDLKQAENFMNKIVEGGAVDA